MLTVFVSLAIIFAMCTKETANVKLDPKITTSHTSNVKWDSATVYGFVVAAGGGFTERGICYSLTPAPTTASNKIVYTDQATTATFKIRLGGLARLTTYYARAYGINASGTIYGEEIIFKTTADKPYLADISASTLAVTTDNGVTATTAINITDDGGPDTTAFISKRGVVFALHSSPTTADSTKTAEGTGKGQFNSLALKLKGNKTYYLRAYATNTIGTTYSNEVSFTTPISFGTAKTNSVTNIAKTTVSFSGLVTYDGGGTISEKGFVYSSNANPTIASTKVPVTSSTDTIKSDITGLSNNTAYHVRAYVTNEAGTYYGVDVPFSTLADITKFWLVGDYNGWTNSDAAKFIISTVSSAGAAEGYAWLTVGGIKLVTDHSWDNAHTYGDNGSGGLTNPGGNITVATAGYYLVKANLSAMTYSITLTNWGIIGDGTAGGWGTQTDMTYYPSSGVWGIYANLSSTGKLKFRGTSDWAVNYGSTAANATLDAGGSNINIPATQNYAIVLDLSIPNTYTYRIDSTWAIIGNATAGGWGADTPMAWDAVNKVFTITTDLVAGDFKFRANHDWAVNLGGTPAALTLGG